jgi:imidazolonepropionase-like amidohydrolase
VLDDPVAYIAGAGHDDPILFAASWSCGLLCLVLRRAPVALLATTALVAAGCRSGEEAPQPTLLVRAARMFDGRHMRSPGSVLIRGDRIVRVGGEVEATRTLDFGDATILPGFIDLHVHWDTGMLAGGVTTMRNVGSSLAALRQRYHTPGIRLFMAGPLISVPGGYPAVVHGAGIAYEVTSAAAARAAVDRLADMGADVIKIALDSNRGQLPLLTTDEVRAIVEEAHARDLEVTAHAEWPDGIQRAVDGGVDELAHVPCGASDRQLQRLQDRDVGIVATLQVIQNAYGSCQGIITSYLQLGGRVLYGTDVGNPRIPVGIDVEELRLMKSAGMTTTQVLAAATSEAGKELGVDQLGTLAEDAPADLIVVRGDARALTDTLARPRLVISAGRIRVRR